MNPGHKCVNMAHDRIYGDACQLLGMFKGYWFGPKNVLGFWDTFNARHYWRFGEFG